MLKTACEYRFERVTLNVGLHENVIAYASTIIVVVYAVATAGAVLRRLKAKARRVRKITRALS
ncbi:MAG TPA: hypothetical protein VEC08_04310, partial [Nitrososphaerales archaeon]|nr:hypothetical protein [Nitrososphaerales archaeon]